MRVGVVGINHKLADLKLREVLAKVCHRRFLSANAIHGDHTFILLSTCNRTEVYFNSQDLPGTHSYLLNILRNEVDEEFDQKLYSYFGVDCFLHLTRVTAGLDSAIVAETEIQGQVKVAYETAREYQCLSSDFHFMFQKALKIGKKTRHQLLLGKGMPDLEDAIWQIGCHYFKEPKNTRILFVGASEINQKIMRTMKGKGLSITLCNRSTENALHIVKQHEIEYLDWKLLSNWNTFDWIIFGTKSPEHLISHHHLLPTNQRKLIIDLCVPRNVDPLIGKKQGITLLNIDQINRTLKIRKKRMNHLLETAETMINDCVKQQLNLFQFKTNSRTHFLAIGA